MADPVVPADLSCVFCDLISADQCDAIGAAVHFEPLNPVTPGHRLIVPRAHLEDAATDPLASGRVFAAAARYAAEQGGDFNLITSAGSNATQTIRHLHVHYVPRRAGDGLALPWTADPAAVPATPTEAQANASRRFPVTVPEQAAAPTASEIQVRLIANMGDLGAIFALRGDRYLPRGGVRHRTRPNFLEPSTLVAACGIATHESYWRGTGTQDEYEHLASIPRCLRCIAAEKGPGA